METHAATFYVAVMPSGHPLVRLLEYLKGQQYAFTAVTPATHARIIQRPGPSLPTLRDIFGWSRSFDIGQLDPELARIMAAADILSPAELGHRSALRVASLRRDLFLHSAFPTDAADAVFFGPDTYRFDRFVAQHWPGATPRTIVDMGAGSGAGGVAAGHRAPSAAITLVDTNARALDLGRINAEVAGVAVTAVNSKQLPPGADLVIANPPYMMDEAKRDYRDGGGLMGGDVALEWARDAIGQMARGGTLLLYTGAAVVDGERPLDGALEQACRQGGATLEIEEIDPDVFGEELEQPPYRTVERIAAIGAVIRLPQ